MVTAKEEKEEEAQDVLMQQASLIIWNETSTNRYALAARVLYRALQEIMGKRGAAATWRIPIDIAIRSVWYQRPRFCISESGGTYCGASVEGNLINNNSKYLLKT